MQTHRPLAAGDPHAVRLEIAAHPFSMGFEAEHITAMAQGASERTFAAGDLVLRHGHPAEALYLLADGDIALEVADPAHEPMTIETIHTGDALGWSWLYPPHTWAFDARCRSESRVLCLDAEHLRALIERDAAFGRELALRIGGVVVERLQSTRAQLVDIHHHDHR